MDTPIKKIKLSNPKTNAKLIESIVSGSIVHFKIPKRKRSSLLAKGYRFTKSPGSKNSFFKAICLGVAIEKPSYYNYYFLFVLYEKPIVILYEGTKKPTVELENIFTIEEFKRKFPTYLNSNKYTIPGIFRWNIIEQQ